MNLVNHLSLGGDPTQTEMRSDTRDPLSGLGGNPGDIGGSWDGPLEGPKKAKKPQKMGFLGGQK